MTYPLSLKTESLVNAILEFSLAQPSGYMSHYTLLSKYCNCTQGLQILLMSGVGVTSASQILESFCNIWSQVSQRKKPFSDFPARGPGMYTLS